MNPLKLLKTLKIAVPSLQRHPESRLQFAWFSVQLGLLLLPFSSLLGILGLLIGAIATWKHHAQTILARPLNQGFALIGLLMILSAVLAYQPLDALLGLFNFLPYFFAFAGLSELIRTPTQRRQIAWLMVIASVPVALIGFAQMLAGWLGFHDILHLQILWVLIEWTIDPSGKPPGRMSSTLSYATVLANYLVITFILGVGLWVEQMHRDTDTVVKSDWVADYSTFNIQHSKLFLPLAIALNAAALILTDSRNGWAIAAGACLLFGLYLGWRWLVAGVATVTGTILAAAFAPMPLRDRLREIVPAFFWARLTDQLYPNRPIPSLRTTQWQFAWSLTTQRPFLGWGLRNFSPLYEAQMHFKLGHPHNLPLMLFCETGVPATVLFLGLVGWMLAQGGLYLPQIPAGRDRTLFFTLFLAFLGDTVFCLFDIALFDARVNILGWVLLAGIWGGALTGMEHKD